MTYLFIYLSLLEQVVFIGMGISSPIWGNVADKYGRKVVSLTSMILMISHDFMRFVNDLMYFLYMCLC